MVNGKKGRQAAAAKLQKVLSGWCKDMLADTAVFVHQQGGVGKNTAANDARRRVQRRIESVGSHARRKMHVAAPAPSHPEGSPRLEFAEATHLRIDKKHLKHYVAEHLEDLPPRMANGAKPTTCIVRVMYEVRFHDTGVEPA
jgi:hypothetical protein